MAYSMQKQLKEDFGFSSIVGAAIVVNDSIQRGEVVLYENEIGKAPANGIYVTTGDYENLAKIMPPSVWNPKKS